MSDYLMLASVIIAAIAAAIAARAAGSARDAAEETKKASFAHFILEDVGAYGSPEMLKAIKRLIKWQEQNPQDFAEKLKKLRYSDDPEVNEVDEARRKVSYYYRLPETLFKFDIIDEEIKDKLRDGDQKIFYEKFVKPLDDKVKKAA